MGLLLLVVQLLGLGPLLCVAWSFPHVISADDAEDGSHGAMIGMLLLSASWRALQHRWRD